MRPSRELFRRAGQTYFATFQTARRQCLFRHQRWCDLLLQTFERYQEQTGLHDFVVMPDHVHLLLSPQVPLERAVQLVKGGFSFQAKRALQWTGDIWQAGFSDHRVRNLDDWDRHIEYLFKNTQSAGSEGRAIRGTASKLALHPLPPWLKPQMLSRPNGGAKAPPLQSRDVSSGASVEARPLQSSSFARDSETRFSRRCSWSPADSSDLHTAKDAEDLFRKLGI